MADDRDIAAELAELDEAITDAAADGLLARAADEIRRLRARVAELEAQHRDDWMDRMRAGLTTLEAKAAILADLEATAPDAGPGGRGAGDEGEGN